MSKKINEIIFEFFWITELVDAPDQEMVDMSNPSRNESDVIFVSAISSNHIGNFNQMVCIIEPLLIKKIKLSEQAANPTLPTSKSLIVFSGSIR